MAESVTTVFEFFWFVLLSYAKNASEVFKSSSICVSIGFDMFIFFLLKEFV